MPDRHVYGDPTRQGLLHIIGLEFRLRTVDGMQEEISLHPLDLWTPSMPNYPMRFNLTVHTDRGDTTTIDTQLPTIGGPQPDFMRW